LGTDESFNYDASIIAKSLLLLSDTVFGIYRMTSSQIREAVMPPGSFRQVQGCFAMGDDDLGLSLPASSATGILECLRMLADEAAELQLDGTLRALHQAIAVCQTERTKINPDGTITLLIPSDVAIH
jgi:hypothetical protein